MNNPKIINTVRFLSALISILIALASLPLMWADFIGPVLAINGTLAHAWPFFVIGAKMIDTGGKLVMSILIKYFPTAVVSLLCFALAGCLPTDTLSQGRNRFNGVTNIILTDMARALGTASIYALSATVGAETPGKQSFLDAAAADLWRQAPLVLNADKVEQIIAAATKKTVPETAAVAAAVYASADPQTPAERTSVVNGIAAMISKTPALGTAILK